MSSELHLKSLAELTAQLVCNGINLETWGLDGYKSPEELFHEIQAGESLLTHDGQSLVRDVKFSAAEVFFKSSEGVLRLREIRENKNSLGFSVSEKIQKNETPCEAMVRGIEEELSLTGVSPQYTGCRIWKSDSASYPGLKAQYTCYTYELWLRPEEFCQEGYREEKKGRTRRFLWESSA